ncbi:MAG: formylglycine-generating enzyme family protein [Gemmataceae bacterium]
MQKEKWESLFLGFGSNNRARYSRWNGVNLRGSHDKAILICCIANFAADRIFTGKHHTLHLLESSSMPLYPELLALLESARRGGMVENLALADWLEENGLEHQKFRGQLVRLQIAIENQASEKVELSGGSLPEMEEYYGKAWSEWRRLTLAYNAKHGSPKESPEEVWLASPTIDLPLVADQSMRFAWVPPGQSWLRGIDGKPGEKSFTLEKGLWCGIYPVTQAQWYSVMGSNPSRLMNKPNNPVEKISFGDVQDFLEKVNRRIESVGFQYRLPSTGEWEYICRGGPISREESAFDFYFARSKTDLTPVQSNDLSSRQANFDGTHPAGLADRGPNRRRTTRVGLFLPNPLGFYDFHGNVWEWTSSRWDEGISFMILRGGCWADYGFFCVAANSIGLDPNSRFRSGFRIIAISV